jgi:hypothetical protein
MVLCTPKALPKHRCAGHCAPAREWIVSATAGRPRTEPKNGRPTCLVEERRAAQGSCGAASIDARLCCGPSRTLGRRPQAPPTSNH